LIALEKDDLRDTGGRNSACVSLNGISRERWPPACRSCLAAAATSAAVPHGSRPTSRILRKWGLTPAKSLQTSYVAAANMLNLQLGQPGGSVEKGKYADIIAVSEIRCKTSRKWNASSL